MQCPTNALSFLMRLGCIALNSSAKSYTSLHAERFVFVDPKTLRLGGSGR